MENVFTNSENSKASEPHRFKLYLTDKRNLKHPKKGMALTNLNIVTFGKTSSQYLEKTQHQYNNSKFKISAPT